jgi:ribosomal protein L15E
MKALHLIRLRGPDERDKARALIGVARRHTIVVFVRPIAVGVAVAGAVMLMLVAVGLAR